jgi:putative ABC transport system permease protein
MFGFAFLAPLLVRPLARLLGAPFTRRLPGRLARENAIRQPQRTAVTAAALMVGLALVVLVTVFAAGIRASVDKTIDEQISAALIVQNQDGFSPIPDGVAGVVSDVPGVSEVSNFRFAVGIVEGEDSNTAVTGVEPATVGSVMSLKWDQGDASTLSSLRDDQVLTDDDWASSRDLEVGDTVTFTTPTGEKLTYELAGTFINQAGLTSDVVAPAQSLADHWNATKVAFVMAAADEGADPEQLASVANERLTVFPAADALSVEQFKDKQLDAVNQLLGLVYALLMLSVIVALLGIVNTLALSVHERTRELGMLRAVGMSRRQVRRMVRIESVITAGIGAVLGIVLGVVFALIVSRPLEEQGFVFTLPVGSLITFFILAALAGVLAAIPPARRASRVDVLRAVTTE